MNHIAIVNIINNGSGQSIFHNGSLIYEADPSSEDDINVVEKIAENLATIHGIEIEFIEHDPNPNWNWNEVAETLKNSGHLPGGLNTYVLHYQSITDSGEITEHTFSYQAESYFHAEKQLLNNYPSLTGKNLLAINNNNFEFKQSLHQQSDTEYTLSPQVGANCWIGVGNANIYIKHEAEGVVVDIYDSECIKCHSSTSAFFEDCVSQDTPDKFGEGN